MSIVLNEYKWAENVLRDKTLGGRPYETLSRLARYYAYNNLSKQETRMRMERFLLDCDPRISTVSWGNAIDKAMKYASKHELIMIDKIEITDKELETISCLDGKQLQRLAFALLCVAKYAYAVDEKTNYWVTTPDSEVMRMANVSTSIKRQSMLFGQLRDLGMIRFSKKIDNLSVQVLFVQDGNVAMTVTDFRNLGHQYMMHGGGNYYVCAECGIVCKVRDDHGVRGRKKKYCADCAAKVKIRQNVNSTMNKYYADGGQERCKVYIHIFPNGKKYFGYTSQPLERRLKNGRGYEDQPLMDAAISEHGWENVKTGVVADGLDFDTAKMLCSALIKEYGTDSEDGGYNGSSIAVPDYETEHCAEMAEMAKVRIAELELEEK